MRPIASRWKSCQGYPWGPYTVSIGQLIYADSLGARRFSEEDLKVLTMLANVAAIQIENHRLFDARVRARRIEQEARTAGEIQRHLLPVGTPEIPGYGFAGFNAPCHEVGGDYYDVLPIGDGRHLIAVGDVAGKGMAAALVMAVLQATVHSVAETDPGLLGLVDRINQGISRSTPTNRFVTLVLLELDSRGHRAQCVNAGHAPAPVLVTAEGKLRRFRARRSPHSEVNQSLPRSSGALCPE